jgi:hypothetical protein
MVLQSPVAVRGVEMLYAEPIIVNFSNLGFTFNPDSRNRRSIGFAPDGRVGVIEVIGKKVCASASLLISSGSARDSMMWSAVCVGALATAVEVDTDMSLWVGEAIQFGCRDKAWESSRLFRANRVTLRFYPVDAVLLTVEADRVGPVFSANDTSRLLRKKSVR